MKVIIVGAGIGGLCSGIALKRMGFDVHIYEQVAEIRPVGAAISVWSNGVKCLNYLGLGEHIRALGGRMDGIAYMDGLSGEEMTGFSLDPLYQRVGQRAYPVARAALQNMLMDQFGREAIDLGVRVVGVADLGDGVDVDLSTGETVRAEFLIGSDGAHSLTRDYVTGGDFALSYSGYVNWNSLVPMDPALAPVDRWTTYVGQGKRVSFMPIAGEQFYVFMDVPLPSGLPNDRDAYSATLKEHFAGWAAPVQALIGQLDLERTNRVEINDIAPFETWVRGRVALLGDAAHRTSPDLGQGGCMAMEDAVVLSWCLAAHDAPLEDRLKSYEAQRVARCSALVMGARKRSAVTHGIDPQVTEDWYKSLRQEDGSGIIDGIAKNIEAGPFR